jgi:penicillin-binding protein 1A
VVIGLIAACVATGAAVGVILHFRKTLPSPAALESIVPPVKTVIYDRNGEEISELFHENRIVVSLSDIPRHLVDAFVVTEDARFREHWGVSPIDNVRAILVNIREKRKAQGASTITQQLARNLFLTHEKFYTRKIKEALLAIEIEKRYTKDEILQMYLNQIYFGHGAYGVESAARLYFGRSVRELGLAECALLAGIPKNPSGYSPIRNPEAAIGRATVVLDLMTRAGAITPNEAAQARANLKAPGPARGRVREAPYFVEHVRQELIERYGPDRLYGGGLRIHTTLDLELQRAAEDILEGRLIELESRNNYAVKRDVAAGDEAGAPEEPGPSETGYVQGAMLALDPSTGAILAMVGGRDFGDSHYNRAVQAHRQPGSAFKIFVYTAAVDDGLTPSDICLDTPMVLPVAGAPDYQPQNYDGEFRGELLVRDAVKHSINIPAVRVLLRLGAERVVDYARRLGIASDLRPVPSLALGSSEVTLLEMTSAFSVFANRGMRAEPLAITRVEDRDGTVLERHEPRVAEVLDPKTAYIMTSMLESVVNEGTAVRARANGITGAAAGKTGTPDDYTDGWFVGFTPEIVCGVWVGFDLKEKIGEDLTGSRTALPIWIDFMKATGHDDDAGFPRPDGIVGRDICLESGLLATPRCRSRRSEIYVRGTEPSLFCDVHGSGRYGRPIEVYSDSRAPQYDRD